MNSSKTYISDYNPLSVWFIGLPCSGKTTLANGVYQRLINSGFKAKVLDGDDLRKGINKNLGFSLEDRTENIRRVAEVSRLFVDEGYITLNAVICPLNEMQQIARKTAAKFYVEIFVDAPIEVCEKRDLKGMYRKARLGEIKHFTGIDSPFEPPVHPDVIIQTDRTNEDECISDIYKFLVEKVKNQ